MHGPEAGESTGKKNEDLPYVRKNIEEIAQSEFKLKLNPSFHQFISLQIVRKI